MRLKRSALLLALLVLAVLNFALGGAVVPRSSTVLLQGYWLAVLMILIVMGEVSTRISRRYRLVVWFLILHAVWLIVYLSDRESLVNLAALAVSIAAAMFLLSALVRQVPYVLLERVLFLSILACLVLSFPLSILLTSVGWPSAPDLYPWAAVLKGERMLLVSGRDVGHSPVVWLAGFVGVYAAAGAAGRAGHLRWRRGVWWALVLAAILVLLASRTRLGVVYSALIVVAWLCARGVIALRWAAIPLMALPLAILAVAVVQPLQGATESVVRAAQEHASWVRLQASDNGQFSVMSGRELLTDRLLRRSLESPVWGLGDGDELLQYGIDWKGNVARFGGADLASESSFRMAVKYGWTYYFFLALLLLVPMSRIIASGAKTSSVVLFFWLLLILTTWVANGGFESYYTISGLFLVMVMLAHGYKMDSSETGRMAV